MQLVDPRRLTGPNFLGRGPLVIVELALDDGEDRDLVRATYLAELGRMRAALGFPAEVRWSERPHTRGTVIAYPEPIDVMLACTEMSEWAALSAVEILAGRAALPIEPKRAEIAAMLERDRSPRLLALQEEASRRGLPFLWDDALVSVGMGSRSVTWPRAEVPEPKDVPWERLGRIPVALVTGTNGKTTSTRLLARMVREGGRRVGSTSSDAITIDGVIVDEGDWTGPAAARVVLQRTDVEVAVLETARGGILRRGLAVDECDVALMTNVTEDHLGSYGIETLDEMARVKGVILDALTASGTAVLNARDPRLVALANGRPHVTFFADLDDARDGRAAAADVIARHRAAGGEVVIASEGRLVCARAGEAATLARIDEIPLTMRGAARFNVENVLGAVAAARALGVADAAIVRALERFTAADNPGRSALVERNGARILLDFGHNPDGVRAVLSLVRALRGETGRLTVITGSAGDRTNSELEGIARAIVAAKPDRVIVRELPGYLRGRALGEVPELFRRVFVELGVPAEAIAFAASEVEALRIALSGAAAGDFVVLLVHLERAEVQAFLTESS